MFLNSSKMFITSVIVGIINTHLLLRVQMNTPGAGVQESHMKTKAKVGLDAGRILVMSTNAKMKNKMQLCQSLITY